MKTHHTLIPAVHLFLIQDNKILLSRRFQTGYEDGNYSVPAGHIEKGEKAIDAVIREAREEVGIILHPKDVDIVHVMQRYRSTPHAPELEYRVDWFFEANEWEGEVCNAEPKKCDDVRWFPLEDLPSNIVDYVVFAIEQHKNKIKFSMFGWE
jgi:8-oxo-dGTP diphosphatase